MTLGLGWQGWATVIVLIGVVIMAWPGPPNSISLADQSSIGSRELTDILRAAAVKPEFSSLPESSTPTTNPIKETREGFDKELPLIRVDLASIGAHLRNSTHFHALTLDDYASLIRLQPDTPGQLTAVHTQRTRQLISFLEAFEPLLEQDLNRQDLHDPTCQNQLGVRLLTVKLNFINRMKPESKWYGVLVSVKNCIHQPPYATRIGTNYLPRVAATAPARVVSALTSRGAVLTAPTSLHELLASPFGISHSKCKNPMNLQYVCGGSSSGSAAAVAAGLVPVALGTDEGGSVRIPAAFTGITALKPTYGRVSLDGHAFALNLSHIGPMANTVRDLDGPASHPSLADAYLLVGSTGPVPPVVPRSLGTRQPQPSELDGVVLGVPWDWVTSSEPSVVAEFSFLVLRLEQLGVKIVNVSIPERKLLQAAHRAIIQFESHSVIEPIYEQHRDSMGDDVRLLHAIAGGISEADYRIAKKLRTHGLQNVVPKLFESVTAILTPATATSPPRSTWVGVRGSQELMVDKKLVLACIEYTGLANLLGLPALVQPYAYDARTNLPFALQLIAGPWNEYDLFRIAHQIDLTVARRAPQVLVSPTVESLQRINAPRPEHLTNIPYYKPDPSLIRDPAKYGDAKTIGSIGIEGVFLHKSE